MLCAHSCLKKAPCENTFRAITNAVLASKACNITGVVAIACAQHGCYTPNSIVNLFKSEQQKNVHFVILKAIESTRVDPDQGILFMYDIVCWYIIYLHERIRHLSQVKARSVFPDGLSWPRDQLCNWSVSCPCSQGTMFL